MVSVFQDASWRRHRHLLNPSKWKEYELHVSGLGFLNVVNPIADFQEIVTPIDALTPELLASMHRKSSLLLIRSHISDAERSMLENAGFTLTKTWGTFIRDLTKPFAIADGTRKGIRKAAQRYTFDEVRSDEDFAAYYGLLKRSRKALGLRTPSFAAFTGVRASAFYTVYVVRDETGTIVAGLGELANGAYMREVHAARDASSALANDFLKQQILDNASARGVRWYDFAGCDPNPKANSKEAAIRAYKEKWGGEFYTEYTFRRRS